MLHYRIPWISLSRGSYWGETMLTSVMNVGKRSGFIHIQLYLQIKYINNYSTFKVYIHWLSSLQKKFMDLVELTFFLTFEMIFVNRGTPWRGCVSRCCPLYPPEEVWLRLGGKSGAQVWLLLQGQLSQNNLLVLEQVLNAVYLNDSGAIPM